MESCSQTQMPGREAGFDKRVASSLHLAGGWGFSQACARISSPDPCSHASTKIFRVLQWIIQSATRFRCSCIPTSEFRAYRNSDHRQVLLDFVEQAAVEEGIVPGGGVALLNGSKVFFIASLCVSFFRVVFTMFLSLSLVLSLSSSFFAALG